MPLPPKPTRNLNTEKEYKRRTRDLIRKCRRELKIHKNDVLDHRHFVGWLITNKTQWSRPTWRQYKSSVAYSLEIESLQHHDPIAQEAWETLMPVDVEGCLPTTKRTSGSKMKRFPLKDFLKIVRVLEENPNRWSLDLINWLNAGLLTGLRPMEWSQTQYIEAEDGVDYLLVKNAKATNNRAHGPSRKIILDGLSNEEKNVIKNHLERATLFTHAGQFKSFYMGCASVLSRTARAVWPKRTEHLTLYSVRHQFSADAKASGLLPEELAALMGHAVDTTAARHYGKKTAGYEMIRVRPDPEEVAKVKTILRYGYNLSHDNKYQPMPKPTPNEV